MRASENQLDQVSITIPLLSCSLHVTSVGTLMLPFKGNSSNLFFLTLSPDFPSTSLQNAAVTINVFINAFMNSLRLVRNVAVPQCPTDCELFSAST